MKQYSSTAGLSLDQLHKQLLNLCLYGVREGITIDDSLADNQAKVIEQAGERVGFIVNSANAKVLKDIANKPRG